MAAYLKFHRLEASPFEGPASARLVLATEAFRDAFAEVKYGLEDDCPRICLSGAAGIGKSSLASALPKLLGDPCLCVLIRDPSVPWARLKASLVRQLELAGGLLSRGTLLQARKSGHRLVVILDQAEKTPAESLEHLDVILGYRSGDDEQLVQCILLANLDSAAKGDEVPLLWWLDRLTTRQLRFATIPESGIRSYVDKHLKKAGWLGDASLFADSAIVAIHRYTGGVPGAVSALGEELLAKAADRKLPRIDATLVEALCERDPDPRAKIRAEAAADECSDGYELASRTHAETLGFDRTPTQLLPTSPAPEPRLEIQQGLLPMNEPDLAPRREVPVAAAFAGPASDSGVREFSPELPPPSGRSARVLRNLTVAGLVTAVVLAVVYWPAGPDDPRPAMRTARPFDGGVTRRSETKPTPAEPVFGLPRPAGLRRTGGLESDPVAQHRNAAKAGSETEASDIAIVFSLAELTDLPAAPEKEDEIQAFEPWSAQEPPTELRSNSD